MVGEELVAEIIKALKKPPEKSEVTRLVTGRVRRSAADKVNVGATSRLVIPAGRDLLAFRSTATGVYVQLKDSDGNWYYCQADESTGARIGTPGVLVNDWVIVTSPLESEGASIGLYNSTGGALNVWYIYRMR